MLAGHRLRQANWLHGDTSAAEVQAFLEDVQKTFPCAGGARPGATVVNREVIGTSKAGIKLAFPGDAAHFLTTSTAIGYHLSGKKATLTLTATGPGLTWEQSSLRRAWMETISQLTADPQAFAGRWTLDSAAAQMEAARLAHGAGSGDWHSEVVLIKDNVTFLYDPSACTLHTGTQGGSALWQDIQQGTPPQAGIDCKLYPHSTIAIKLALHAYARSKSGGNQGRLGKPENRRGCWIGGGGNVAVDGANPTAGRCREMCGNFLVVVAFLVYVSGGGGGDLVTEEERKGAGRNLDWLLGGQLDGSGVGAGVARPEWLRFYLH